MKPGTRAVLELLRHHPEGVTALTALDEIGSFRLAARIFELEVGGFEIDREWLTTPRGKRVVRYVLREQLVLAL